MKLGKTGRWRVGAMLVVAMSVVGATARAQYTTHQVGNSYGDADGYVPNLAQTVWADDSGVYLNADYDERAKEIGVYTSSGGANGRLEFTHFDNDQATTGRAIAGNGTYVWATIRNGGRIGRWNRSSRQPTGVITGVSGADVAGLAVRGTRLYASDSPGNAVKFYNIGNGSAGSYIGQFYSPSPGHLAVDSIGNVWVQEVNSSWVRCYNPDSGQELEGVNLGDGLRTGPIAVYSADGAEHLLVSERVRDLNIKVYRYNGSNVGGSVSYETNLGDFGGYLGGAPSEKGRIGPFRFSQITGLSADSGGNVYVACNGWTLDQNRPNGDSADVRKFSRVGTASWSYSWALRGLNFEGNGSVDPATKDNSSLDIYTGSDKFSYDPSSGGWDYVARTVDPISYPDDPRLEGKGPSPDFVLALKRINGQKVMFCTSQNPSDDYNNQSVYVYRFDPSNSGEIAIYTGQELDAYNGVAIDDDNAIWGVTGNQIVYRPFTGSGSNPSWGGEQRWTVNIGSGTDLKRIEYDAANNKAYILLFNDQWNAGPGGSSSGLGGRVLARLRREGGGWVEEARIVIPHKFNSPGDIDAPQAMAWADQHLFITYYSNQPGGSSLKVLTYSVNFGNNPNNVSDPIITMTSNNGSINPGYDVDSHYGVRAVRRSNGEYIVTSDDYALQKIVIHKWNPGGGGGTTPNPTSPPVTGGIPIGNIIALRAANNQFVSANLNDPDTRLEASFAGSVGEWERFRVDDAGNGQIALFSTAANRYVSVDNGRGDKLLRAGWSTSIGDWEKFTWADRGNGRFALRSNVTGRYVSANLNAGGVLVAEWAGEVGSWEEFSYELQCLSATYFDNANLTGASVSRRDKEVNFNWGSKAPIAGKIAANTFSVRWTGFVVPKYTQAYTFFVKADDGVRLWINNTQRINGWKNVSTATEHRTVTVNLMAGQRYPIKLEYYQNTGNASCQLLWSSASQRKEVIPDAATRP